MATKGIILDAHFVFTTGSFVRPRPTSGGAPPQNRFALGKQRVLGWERIGSDKC